MNALRTTFQRVARTPKTFQKRQMGGHAQPKWEGIDKIVRGYFPEDYQREYYHIIEIVALFVSLYLVRTNANMDRNGWSRWVSLVYRSSTSSSFS